MVHQYKLTYFNGRGRAEPARLILAYADAKYEDNRVEGATWAALKPKTPFGQVPVLEIDGGKVTLAQSKTIYRYLANEFNLVPKDHIQAARADMLVDGHDDVLKHFTPWFLEKDPAKKQEIWKKLETEHIAPFVALYEKFLTTNGTGYFVTNSITWADIYLYDVFSSLKSKSPHLFEGHAKLAEFVDKIGKEPKIKAWVDKRPKTDF
jgi:glutathione S-transferase